jgi:hypothetical protein
MAYTRKTTDIITSNDFDYVLNQIEDKSEVARLLLKQRHPIENVVDGHINYISISNSDRTKISYLTPERIESLISNGEDLWTSPKRFHIKPGAFVSKLFKDVSPREVEIFSTLFRNVQSKINLRFEVISGSKIRDYYHHESYHSETGSLGNSCMKYDSCQEYLDLYVTNSNLVKMLVAIDNNNKLIGRALIWTSGDTKIMDRIYTINDENFQFHFKKWADENGYWYKKEQRWNNTLYFESKGKVIYKEICFDFKNINLGYYPYMDTFKFIDLQNNRIYNYQPDGVKFKTISSADGQIQPSDIYSLCEKTKTYHSSDNINYIPNRGIRVSSDLTVYSDVYDLYILREDAYYDSNLRDWIYQDIDLNNDVLINKKRSEIIKNNRWTDLLSVNMEYNITPDDGHEESPQDIEYHPF